MNLKKIISFDALRQNLTENDNSFLLIYKSGSEQSECALRNISETIIEKKVNIMVADVNHVRDIHENYNVSSAPALLQFERNKLIQIIKGCHEPEFFKSIFDNSLYSATQKGEEKKLKRVTVYTTPTCPHCTTLKNYLKDNKVQFRDVNVASDQNAAMQMVKKSGQQGVPQIEINGRIVVGFDKPKIDELLEIR